MVSGLGRHHGLFGHSLSRESNIGNLLIRWPYRDVAHCNLQTAEAAFSAVILEFMPSLYQP